MSHMMLHRLIKEYAEDAGCSQSFAESSESILERRAEVFTCLQVPITIFQRPDVYENHNIRCTGTAAQPIRPGRTEPKGPPGQNARAWQRLRIAITPDAPRAECLRPTLLGQSVCARRRQGSVSAPGNARVERSRPATSEHTTFSPLRQSTATVSGAAREERLSRQCRQSRMLSSGAARAVYSRPELPEQSARVRWCQSSMPVSGAARAECSCQAVPEQYARSRIFLSTAPRAVCSRLALSVQCARVGRCQSRIPVPATPCYVAIAKHSLLRQEINRQYSIHLLLSGHETGYKIKNESGHGRRQLPHPESTRQYYLRQEIMSQQSARQALPEHIANAQRVLDNGICARRTFLNELLARR
ncbi:hypothetical protein DFP73DRAFT_599058 [Morchella snyderi]|nr:hypothetical protein DFP73DRAFT_599058 [Morchella snyderi]